MAAVRSDLAKRIGAREFLPLLTEGQGETVAKAMTDNELAVLSLPKEDLVRLVDAWKSFASDAELAVRREGRLESIATRNGSFTPDRLRDWAVANEDRIRGCLGATAIFPGDIRLDLRIRASTTGEMKSFRYVSPFLSGRITEFLPEASMWSGAVLLMLGNAGGRNWMCINQVLDSAAFLPPADPDQHVPQMTVVLEDTR